MWSSSSDPGPKEKRAVGVATGERGRVPNGALVPSLPAPYLGKPTPFAMEVNWDLKRGEGRVSNRLFSL